MAYPMKGEWGKRPPLKARRLLDFSTKELRQRLKGRFDVEFEDGEVVSCTAEEIIYSSYFWVFHRLPKNKLKLTSKYLARAFVKKDVSTSTHLEYLKSVFWDSMEGTGLKFGYEIEPYLELMYMTINRLICEYDEASLKHQRLLDAFHMQEVVDNPDIVAIKEKLRNGEATIAETNSGVISVLRNDPKLRNNIFSKTVRNGLANNTQLAQCFGVRGQVTEVDDYIIPRPVLSGFAEGLRNMFEYFAESRTAAGALMYAENPLQDSEYMARRLHFLVMTILRINDTDCGSRDYVDFFVRGKETEAGRVTYQGDLENLEGKYMLNASGGLSAIKATDKHLEGTTVKLRDSIYCKDKDKYGICRICFGDMVYNLNPDFNLGHYSTTEVTQKITQSILGRKHVAESSVSKKITLPDAAKLFFQIGGRGSAIMLKPTKGQRSILLIIPQRDAHGLQDAVNTKDPDKLSISRLSSVSSCQVVNRTKTIDTVTPVSLEVDGRKVVMTKEFIMYIRSMGLTANNTGGFVIDMEKWDYKLPLFIAPDMEYSFVRHAKLVSNMIESKMEEINDRADPESPESTLLELYQLVNSKQSVNLSLLGVIIYASMIADPKTSNFDLSRGKSRPGLGVSGLTLTGRSLSAAAIYENQTKSVFCNPESFSTRNRPNSPFDVLFAPQEAVDTFLKEEGISDINAVPKARLFNERFDFVGLKL